MSKDRSKYPLTLQHLNKINHTQVDNKPKKIFVEKIHCNHLNPENFYRPMSKIININEIK